MIDYRLIKNEIKKLFELDDEKIEKYDSLIQSTANGIFSCLNSEPDENGEGRLNYLCAVKSYYLICLCENDNVKSFSAGDVSYTAEDYTSCIKIMLEEAYEQCRDLFKAAFVFEAV